VLVQVIKYAIPGQEGCTTGETIKFGYTIKSNRDTFLKKQNLESRRCSLPIDRGCTAFFLSCLYISKSLPAFQKKLGSALPAPKVKYRPTMRLKIAAKMPRTTIAGLKKREEARPAEIAKPIASVEIIMPTVKVPSM